jgi:hypothetical protein
MLLSILLLSFRHPESYSIISSLHIPVYILPIPPQKYSIIIPKPPSNANSLVLRYFLQ